jgi:hypothetical protein
LVQTHSPSINRCHTSSHCSRVEIAEHDWSRNLSKVIPCSQWGEIKAKMILEMIEGVLSSKRMKRWIRDVTRVKNILKWRDNPVRCDGVNSRSKQLPSRFHTCTS